MWCTYLGERQVQGWNGVILELVLGEEYGPEEDPVALGVRKQTQQLKTGDERKAVTGARLHRVTDSIWAPLWGVR